MRRVIAQARGRFARIPPWRCRLRLLHDLARTPTPKTCRSRRRQPAKASNYLFSASKIFFSIFSAVGDPGG